MPRFRQHLLINLTAVAALDVAAQFSAMQRDPRLAFDWRRFVVGVSLGGMAGALPDLLEPSIGNPNHRGFAHSLSAAVIAWWLAAGRHSEGWPRELRHVGRMAAVGYCMHLAADIFLSKAKGMGLFGREF